MLCAGLPPRLYESLKALCCLANAAGPLQAHEIAAAAGLPPAQTAKILQLMTWAGFVESRRGAKGGFWLVTAPARIRVTDVADFFVHHTQGHPQQKRDGLLKALEQATARCHKEFERITVADLAKTSGCERTGNRTLTKVVSTLQHRKPKQMKGAVGRKRFASILLLLVVASVHIGSLACSMPGCASTNSASKMHCAGMGIETDAVAVKSAERMPCCQFNNLQSDKTRGLAILPTHSASPVQVVLQASSVRPLLTEPTPLYRVDFSPPKSTSFLCTLLI